MKHALEAKLSRIREMDAFLAVRVEFLLGLAAVTMVVGLGLFLWHAMIRGHALWIVTVCSLGLGTLIGIPIGRFFMPLAVGYVRSLHLRLETTRTPGRHRNKHLL